MTHPKFTRALTLFFSFALLFVVATPAPTQQPATKNITILYSNDFHAAVEPMTATWLVDQPKIGGVRDFAAWIDVFRTRNPATFLFDSGDLFTGQAISFLSRGQALIDIWKAVGFDAVCLGNHEFDYGLEGASNYIKGEPFPVLSANLFYKKDGAPFAKPYAILEKSGVRVAVIGIFGVDAASATTLATWDALEVRDPVPILSELVPQLRKQADIIVVLSHAGETGPMQSDAEAHPEVQRKFDADIAIVEAVPGIDVYVGGHAHRGIEIPWVSPKTGGIIVQTYGRGTTLGVLQLAFDAQQHRIVSHSGSLVRVMNGVFPVPQNVDTVAKNWEAKADREGKEIVGHAPEQLVRNYNGESALGDLVADAMLWRTGTTMAFENAGGIRGDLQAGPVTRYDAISVVPFMNTNVTMQLSGKDIRAALEQSLTLKVGALQIAGLVVAYDPSAPEYHRVLSVEVVSGAKKEPLDDNRLYPIVASSFIAGGGDHYDAFLRGKNVHDTGELLCDVLTAYARHAHTLARPAGPRQIPKLQ